MDLSDWLTLAVALGGLSLSVYNTLVQRRTRTPQVEVTARIGPHSDERHELTFFRAVAKNVGDVPTTLKAAGVILPDGEELAWPFKVGHREHTAAMPYCLQPAKTYLIGTTVDALAYLVAERGYKVLSACGPITATTKAPRTNPSG